MPNSWVREAIEKINADFNRSADTHLILVPFPPAIQDIKLYIKDESTHITGSLKHRLARSLFLYALCNGWVRQDTPIIEASSGSTAISEAYYARLLGLPFYAVMSNSTSPEKIRRIEQYNGTCILVDDPSQDRIHAQKLAQELHGHFMDQFTYAERATDWRGNNNIAESLFKQLDEEPYPVPHWIVCGAGTGGTAATLGRYIRYRGYDTQICVVDPEYSVYYNYFQDRNSAITIPGGSGIEGIGRPQVEPSFLPDIIDLMLKIPNAASMAAMHFLAKIMDRRYGGSTGTNFYGACSLIAQMLQHGMKGSIVIIGCDSGEIYRDTYYNEKWLAEKDISIEADYKQLARFLNTGQW